MSQPLSNRILAGALTFLGLGVVWMVIIGNLSTQQDLSANESLQPPAQPVAPNSVPEPVLDLSIPGVPSGPQPASETPGTSAMTDRPRASMPLDRRAAQVARLRCEAEVEQLCPESSDGSGRRQCVERRAQQLPAPCQQQIRERLVRWKEERGRLILACQADIKRFCPDVRPGGGPQLQCLQQHAQELSDGCYGMLPKGRLYFKQ
ncbi:MAG TPA: cysteine rich repeat-containing protein [Nitrospira sp.]|nr:cysteine rich repeat-containing protein [Nitrospira sp.]